MSHLSELDSYIVRLQRRLRLGVCLRGAAVFTASALAVTLLLVVLLNRLAFPAPGVLWGRLALFIVLAAAAGFGTILPLTRLTCGRAVRQAEAASPDLEQRLTTFYERKAQGGNSFLELLAADTLARAKNAPPSLLVPDNRLLAMSGSAFACLGVLVWMIAAGPGYLGYGASLLWTGQKTNAPPMYALTVSPGDITVRRHSDQLITARVTGMRPDRVRLFAHYERGSGWEPVLMQAQPDSAGAATWHFVLAGLPENVEYYVAAGPLVSPHYNVHVVDLPSVKAVTITYHYPAWTGMKPVTEEEHGGDLRALEGTDATIRLQIDRPLKNGILKLDDGHAIQLTGGEGNRYQGSIHMEKDGAWHLAAIDQGREVRLSEDYFIATDKAAPPQIAIDRPAGDYRASPIEEVTVGVKATDPFGLKEMHLHYSVNGGPDRDISMLKTPGGKSADGSFMLPLEEFKLQPGDLVSVYATARDSHLEAKTDISFIQVDPFEREFSQSQQSGGGGGGGGGQNSQTDISRREKELISATWKQQNEEATSEKDALASGQFLSDAQEKLRGQVLSLSARMQSRDLSEANEEFTAFDRDMQNAAAAMSPSAEKLRARQWKDALPFEQKALQALLRAEATFRQIQVAFGQQGGGGGGGNTGRDLASLFDLELDTEKNQYETAQNVSPAEQHAKDVEAALEKLDALAKRQQDLAAQRHNPEESFEERWQQEMLRRQAEQLQREMEQLAKNGQQSVTGSSQSQSSAGQQSASSGSVSRGQMNSQSSSGRSGGEASSQSGDQRTEQALNRLREANRAMRRSGDAEQNREAAQEAAEQLRQAQQLLAGTQQQLAAGRMDSLAREADRLTHEERKQSDQINRLAGRESSSGLMDRNGMMARLRERDRLAAERQQLSDELSNLQQNLRGTARDLASNQPTAARKVRDALTQMDESDLANHVQRSADWLRRGINPNANGTEDQIADGLHKLDQQLQQAQAAIGKDPTGRPANGQTNANEALNQVERLRSEIEAMTDSRRGSNEGSVPSRQNAQGGGQRSTDGGGQGSTGEQGVGSGQPDQWQSGSLNRRSDNAGRKGGDDPREPDSSALSGDIRSGGSGRQGTVWGNINTGDNHYGSASQWAAPTDASGNPADTERTYEQGLRELRQLRQTLQSDPEAAREVDELARKMRELDPRRFPGNPAVVEQLHQEVVASVDRLELQLRRDGASSQPRTGAADIIPEGYRNSVAEYYRQLSGNKQPTPQN
jgi:hypothetical protein